MDDQTFKRVLTSFADSPADLDLSKGELIAQVREEVVQARVFRRSGSLFVEENGDAARAEDWLVRRVARLPLLADRILTHVPAVPHFVTPSGALLDRIDSRPDEAEVDVEDSTALLADYLGQQPAGTSSVLYLTSDAGEGKTSLITEVARRQAKRYREKTSDWLLVPVSLGGRTFLRLDDVVVGALVNRLRFQLLYFDAFVELVRMGVIVLALDGFEEMFVEGAAGDAVSALGSLMQAMHSSGSVLISARSAYFDYKSLETQTKLFDALGSESVTFARLRLKRWDRATFLKYAALRNVAYAEEVHSAVVRSLGAEHPLLQRAVLVRRLLDVASEATDLETLLPQLQRAPDEYFAQFVSAILNREAREKWIDRAGEAAEPLLSSDEHEELLSWVAHEMWLNQSATLGSDLLDLAAELFCESRAKPPRVKRQVQERIKQHALLVRSKDGPGTFAFDHEEFYYFFLGRSVARMLASASIGDMRHGLGRGALPTIALETAVASLGREMVGKALANLSDVCRSEATGSFVRENAGGLAIRMIDKAQIRGAELRHMVLPAGAFEGRTLAETVFESCYVYPTGITGGSLRGSKFIDCSIERLELPANGALDGVDLVASSVAAVTSPGSDQAVFSPPQIASLLVAAGARLSAVIAEAREEPVTESDPDLLLAQKVFRKFLRATQMNENTLRQHLGVRGHHFMEEVLPGLLKAGVLQEVEYHGAGQQRRFRMRLAFRTVGELLAKANGRFTEFLRLAARVS